MENETNEKQKLDKETKKILGLFLVVLIFLAISFLKTTIAILIFGGICYWAYKKNKERNQSLENSEQNDVEEDS